MLIDYSCVNTQTLRFAALWYAAHGFRVFPVHPNAKTPLVRWKDEATVNWKTVRAWWTLYPNANIGLAMGEGWHCLDVDVRDGGDNGELSYAAAGGLAWSQVEQPVAITPGGGRHLLFWSEGASYKNFARKGTHGGLDMRSDGGYILAAPSVIDGKTYRWSAGDPQAHLPGSLLRWIERASQGQRVDHTTDFPLVAPSDLTEAEVTARLDALPAPERAFLRTGEVVGGDQSSAAYWACYTAFRWGWSLEDMARIGPETTLATFGADPPHGAPDPWGWCWRYTVRAAWEASDGQRVGQLFEVLDSGGAEEKRTPGQGGDEGATRGLSRRGDSGGVSSCLPLKSEPTTSDPFTELMERVSQIGIGDVRRVEALLQAAAGLDLDALRVDALLQQIKTFAQMGIGALRERYKVLTNAARTAAAQERRAGGSAAEVYVRDQGKLYDRISGQLITEQAFKTSRARDHGGDAGAAMDHWVTGAGAVCERVESLSYDPALPSGVATDHRGVTVFNTYRGSDIVAREGDVSLWLGLLDALQLGGGQPSRDMLLDYLAYLVQCPGGKTSWGVMLGGRHGIGKDSFLAPVLDVVGRHNTTVVSGAEVANPAFSDYLADCKLLVVNEIHGHGTAEVLKPALAAPPDVLRVNRKNLRPYDVPNRLALIAMTNHYYPFTLDPGERRWFCLWADARLPTDPHHPVSLQWAEFFGTYWAWVRSGVGPAAIAHWLGERDLKAFRPTARPICTDWQVELMTDAGDVMDDWIREQIAERRGALALPLCDIESVAHDAQQVAFRLGPNPVTATRVRQSLARCGVPRRRVRGVAGTYGYFPAGLPENSSAEDILALRHYRVQAGIIR